MAVAFRSAATGTSDGSATVTVNKPSGAVQGDVLWAHLHPWINSGNLSTASLTMPPGWGEVSSMGRGDNLAKDFLCSKVAGASEPASYDFTLSVTPIGFEGSMLAVQGSDGGYAAVNASTGAASNPDPPDPGGDPGYYLALAFASTMNASHTPPSGYTERVDAEFITAATKSVTAPEDPGAFGASSSQWIAFSLLVHAPKVTKTLEYWFPTLLTAADAADTNFAQITAYIPEFSGEVVFKKCYLEVMALDRATTVSNTTRRQLSISVGGAGYTVVNNTNTLAASGETYVFSMSADFTAHFVSNWTSGTSKTVDARVLFDSAMASATGYGNVTARLVITFEYDAAQATHAKTVWIPLDAPLGALPTSKPGSPNAGVIPLLDTYCPESSKTFRQVSVILQGNASCTSADVTLNMQVDTLGAFASTAWEATSAVDYFCRAVYQPSGMSTSATHDVFIWASSARFNHPQMWLVVTYEFDATGSTDGLVSVWVPMLGPRMAVPGVDSDTPTYFSGLCGIPEANPVVQRGASYFFWQQSAAVAGLNISMDGTNYSAYTDIAVVLGGSNAAMKRYDSWTADTSFQGAFVEAFVYKTDTVDLVTGLSGWFLLNYTADKPAAGYGAMNHMVMWSLGGHETAAAAQTRIMVDVGMPLNDWPRFVNGYGVVSRVLKNSTTSFKGFALFGDVYDLISIGFDSDDEVGVYVFVSGMTERVARWYNHLSILGDAESLMDPNMLSNWTHIVPVNGSLAFFDTEIWAAISSIAYTLTGTLSNYDDTEDTDVRAYSDEQNGNMLYLGSWTARTAGNLDPTYLIEWGWPCDDVRVVAGQTTERGWNDGTMT